MSFPIAVLLFASIAAIACGLVPQLVTPLVTLPPNQTPAQQWRSIASALGSSYGATYSNSEIYQVRVPTKTCVLGVCGASLDVSFIKPCGKTLAQAANEIADGIEGNGQPPVDGGGGSDGPGSVPGNGGGIGLPLPPSGCVFGCGGRVDIGPIQQH